MKYYYYFLILLLIFPFNQGRRLRNNGKVRSLINSSSTPSYHSNDDNNLFIDTNSNGEEDIFTEPPWTDKQIIEEILKRYRFPDSSSNISVAVFVVIDKFLPSSPDVCSLQLKIKQKWLENRLSYRNFRDSIHPIKFRSLNYIWSPSLNIDNAISMTGLGKEDIKVYSNGMVEYEQKYQITVDTYGSLINYPFDIKNCSIYFSNDDSRASWSYLSNADVGGANIRMISGWQAVSWSRGHHSLLITIKRNVQSLIFNYFIPTMLLSIISIIPLFFSPFSKFNRIIFGSIIFLTTFFLTLYHFGSIPNTFYLKAIEIWALFTNIFTFGALTESIFITNCAFQRILRPPTLKANRSNYYEENDERTKWINEAPYYSQMTESKPRSIVTLLDCLFRFILLISLISFIMYFFLRFYIPYWDYK
ncbi:Neurotransmitter-gated ion-channel transmembrane domain and Neurotransmitter-gated ion-channel ligand-binding domain-containing protein [Strongyloides ratti]|uniref:Neurotransmitter-gated ion-channel transmembrane domain and Neurotransmitter-gated ion-channel ligand-binding domain-containing protein n=1 Tax=Strongyloides ratti TaxID=34506 RepID=A0A090LCZ5_STRRB|nr:Neurotransmitter-gated ion-channel transmembrane domain and Neurotransmitter-gated ion-channel ligand-binding domain-containing protein [Strongyloides ratti]CEF65385.1 Neurotransmitter-gated ion-channel transmembrane domain and Neurotransmitter-gated ion-channel ligand-binding domain-containing protein [Strongyloides ratti]